MIFGIFYYHLFMCLAVYLKSWKYDFKAIRDYLQDENQCLKSQLDAMETEMNKRLKQTQEVST